MDSLLAPALSAGHLAGTPRPGRPRGARARIFAEVSELTTADFAYVRGALQGAGSLPALYWRYYPHLCIAKGGDSRPPAFSVAVGQLRDLHRRIVQRARVAADEPLQRCAAQVDAAWPSALSDQAADASHPTDTRGESTNGADPGVLTFDEWLEAGNADFFHENEWHERYQDYVADAGPVPAAAPSPAPPSPARFESDRRSAAIASAVAALGYLQTVLAADPRPSDRLGIWVCKSLTERFGESGLQTMDALRNYISRHGRNWWRNFRKLGPLRAQAIETWFAHNADTLKPLDRSGPHWAPRPPLSSAIQPLQRPQSQIPLMVYQPTGVAGIERPTRLALRTGIAPLELLLVPPALDGSAGTFRVSGANALGARSDQEAVFSWLRSYLAAGKHNTFRAYRREIERFYLWCILVARTPLSSVTADQASAYRSFLQAIPPAFVGNDRVSRDDPAWRPFRGPLNPRSQAYAIGVIGQFYSAMVRAGYCAIQPFGMIRTARSAQQAMDTTRSLSEQDLAWLRDALLARVQASERRASADAAMRTRRLRLMLQLALQSGMRLEEMANASTRDLRPAVMDGVVSSEDWMLRVVGKGQRTREIPVRRELYDLVLEHHRDIQAVLERSPDNAARLEQIRQRPPLIGAMAAPAGSVRSQIGADTELANDNLALSRAGIYAMLKRFVRQAVADGIRAGQREVRIREQLLKDIGGSRDEARLLAASQALRQAREDLSAWERRAAISTHWLRHTFATRLLRANRGDDGLKLAQQLLGHASIATTAEYVKQGEADKVRGVRRVVPVDL